MMKTWNVKWNEVKILSLDIFDTLLFRRSCKNSTDIFTHQHALLIEHKLISASTDAIEWRELRIFAEHEARKKADNRCGEVTLKEIYQQFPSSIVSKTLQDECIRVELETEKQFIEVDPCIVDLITEASRRNIPYICVSDTYFNLEQINDLLTTAFNKRGFRLPTPQSIFLSSELKETKSQRLFAAVLSKLALPAHTFLHVGDNLTADVKGAKEYGIEAIHYTTAYPWQQEVEQLEARLYSQLDKDNNHLLDNGYSALRRKIANRYSDYEIYKTLAAFVYGPIFHHFGSWCLQKAKSEQIKKIVCFTRESHLLTSLLQTISADTSAFEIKPLAISRQYANLLTIEDISVTSLRNLFSFEQHVSGEEFLTTLGLNEQDNSYVKKQTQIPANAITKVLTLVLSENDYIIQISNYIEQQKSNFLDYLHQINFFTDETVAVCDLGWSGTTQTLLRKFLDSAGKKVNMVGLYFATTKSALNVLSEQDRLYSYLIQFGEPVQLAEPFFRAREIIELLTMPEHGTLSHFNGIEPYFSKACLPENQLQQIAEMQEGIITFCQMAERYQVLGSQHLTQALLPMMTALVLRALICPTIFEVKLLQHWHHEFKSGDKRTELLIPTKKWLNRRLKNQTLVGIIQDLNFYQVHWLGAAILSLGGNLVRDNFVLHQFHQYQFPEATHKTSLLSRFKERRREAAKQSEVKICNTSYFFNREWYLNFYSDVRHTGEDPAVHYIMYGAFEGRDPGPYFSTKAYLRDNPEVKIKGLNPLVHFETIHRKNHKKKNPYQGWVEAYDQLNEIDRKILKTQVEHFSQRPIISILLPVSTNNKKLLTNTIVSVLSQIYPEWELCMACNPSTKVGIKKLLIGFERKDPRVKLIIRDENSTEAAVANSALQSATGDFIALLEDTDELSERALFRVAEEFNSNENVALIYTDEDCINDKGKRSDPYFKSDWNPDLFHGQDYITHLAIFKHSVVTAVGGFIEEFKSCYQYDLALRVTEVISPKEIHHIPDILYHRHNRSTPSLESIEYTRRALQAHFERLKKSDVRVVPHPELAGSHRVIYPLPKALPLVSIIVPTKDRLELLKPCIDSVMELTDYPNFEVLIIDNQSSEDKTHAYFRQLNSDKIKVVSYPFPYNFSKINNFALEYTQGELITFLNNDIKVISRHWLSELVSHALRPEIGMVGAKLYYPDDTIQHAGVIGGIGSVAGHIFCHFPRKSMGYKNKTMFAQNFLAVTAACSMMRRSVFEEVGKYDELLAVDYNDVDLCLRVYEKGYRILWTPFAELYHFESATRGKPKTAEAIARFHTEIEYIRRRWGDLLLNDPFYNPNLSLHRSNCSLAFPPRKGKDTVFLRKELSLP